LFLKLYNITQKNINQLVLILMIKMEMVCPRNVLRTIYREHMFQEERVKAGRELGYSETRIAFNEFVRGLEVRIDRFFQGHQFDDLPADVYSWGNLYKFSKA